MKKMNSNFLKVGMLLFSLMLKAESVYSMDSKEENTSDVSTTSGKSGSPRHMRQKSTESENVAKEGKPHHKRKKTQNGQMKGTSAPVMSGTPTNASSTPNQQPNTANQ